jgi:hypothetical protein
LFKPLPLLDTTELVSDAALVPLITHVAVVPPHGVATVCINVIVVGAADPPVPAFGVHVYTIDAGFVPSVPTVETCVTTMVSPPAVATAAVVT